MVARLSVASLAILGMMGVAQAADPNPPQGLWLATDYPALQVRAGDDTTLPLTIYNYGLPPQRTAITITKKPADWTTEIDGNGKPVSAAFVDHDGRALLSLKLKIPASAKPGPYTLVLHAQGDNAKSDLPIAIDLAAPLAAKMTATPKLPILKGTPKSKFDFDVTVKNDSASDELVNMTAETPKGFTATFKQNYGAQELTSIPIKAGASADISVSVKPSELTKAGTYPVIVDFKGQKASAETKLVLDVAGQPSLSLAGKDDRLSGDAYAGKETTFPLVLRNDGSADATDVSLSASPPSGWKVTFEPKKVESVPAGGEAKVQATVTPSAQAISGDYVVSMSASGDGLFENARYRVTVLTSTLWGVTGLAVIAAALLVLVGAVARFGRR